MVANGNHSFIADLRFALDVMNERSNLGLDSLYASQLMAVIQRQIAQAGAATNRPSDSITISSETELVPV
jgi:hypothetical protein